MRPPKRLLVASMLIASGCASSRPASAPTTGIVTSTSTSTRATITTPFVTVPIHLSGGPAQFSPSEANALPNPAPGDLASIAVLARGAAPSAGELEAERAMANDMASMRSRPETLDATARIRREIAAARRAATRWRVASSAVADGYLLASRALPGIGSHWIDWSLVTAPFDAGRPAMLLYDGNDPSARLVGLSYFVQSRREPTGFTDGGARWHRHLGLCIVHGRLVAEGISERGLCDGGRGALLPGRDIWMLHVWIVPGVSNPNGMFASLNAALCSVSAPCDHDASKDP